MPAFIPKLLENTAERGNQTLPGCWADAGQHGQSLCLGHPGPFIFLWICAPFPFSSKAHPQIGLLIVPLCYNLGVGRGWGWKPMGCRLS